MLKVCPTRHMAAEISLPLMGGGPGLAALPTLLIRTTLHTHALLLLGRLHLLWYTGNLRFKGPFDAFRAIVAKHGPRGLYRGMLSHSLRLLWPRLRLDCRMHAAALHPAADLQAWELT